MLIKNIMRRKGGIAFPAFLNRDLAEQKTCPGFHVKLCVKEAAKLLHPLASQSLVDP